MRSEEGEIEGKKKVWDQQKKERRKTNKRERNGATRGGREGGLCFTDLLFDLSLTCKRPQTDMWLPSGLVYHAIMPADLFLNVSWIVPLRLV